MTVDETILVTRVHDILIEHGFKCVGKGETETKPSASRNDNNNNAMVNGSVDLPDGWNSEGYDLIVLRYRCTDGDSNCSISSSSSSSSNNNNIIITIRTEKVQLQKHI